MRDLQATWTPDGRLFFWSPSGNLSKAVDDTLPALNRSSIAANSNKRSLAVVTGLQIRRKQCKGLDVTIADAVPILAAIPQGAFVSDSLKCWSLLAKLGLELAANQRAVPTVNDGRATWKALVTRPQDLKRLNLLAAALPPSSRAMPARNKGAITLPTSLDAARAFLDKTIDALYRQDVYPGTTRGWVLEFAEALRKTDDERFTPRDARFQGIPQMLASWSQEAESTGLRLGMELMLPKAGSSTFTLKYRLFALDAERGQVSLEEAWEAGDFVTIESRDYPHPAHAALRLLARAGRIFPPLRKSLEGNRPSSLTFDPSQTWRFLNEGVHLLREAGFGVRIPLEFAKAGCQRIRARMRVEAECGPDGKVDLSQLLKFRWEVTLGDLILDGASFAEIDRKSVV